MAKAKKEGKKKRNSINLKAKLDRINLNRELIKSFELAK